MLVPRHHGRGVTTMLVALAFSVCTVGIADAKKIPAAAT